MRFNYFILLAVIIGIVCGFLSTHVLLIGWFGKEKKPILWAGALYGFSMSMSFLLSGFQGASDRFSGFVALSLGLSIVGALGGIFTAWIRYVLNKKRK